MKTSSAGWDCISLHLLKEPYEYFIVPLVCISVICFSCIVYATRISFVTFAIFIVYKYDIAIVFNVLFPTLFVDDKSSYQEIAKMSLL